MPLNVSEVMTLVWLLYPFFIAPGEKFRLADSVARLYTSAEGSSAVIADLDANVLVTVVDREALFIRVRLVDGLAGSYRYVVRSPDVRGGDARVEGTRIAVRDVIGRFGLLCLRFRVRLGCAR
jgi:hypothetical protein